MLLFSLYFLSLFQKQVQFPLSLKKKIMKNKTLLCFNFSSICQLNNGEKKTENSHFKKQKRQNLFFFSQTSPSYYSKELHFSLFFICEEILQHSLSYKWDDIRRAKIYLCFEQNMLRSHEANPPCRSDHSFCYHANSYKPVPVT